MRRIQKRILITKSKAVLYIENKLFRFSFLKNFFGLLQKLLFVLTFILTAFTRQMESQIKCVKKYLVTRKALTLD